MFDISLDTFHGAMGLIRSMEDKFREGERTFYSPAYSAPLNALTTPPTPPLPFVTEGDRDFQRKVSLAVAWLCRMLESEAALHRIARIDEMLKSPLMPTPMECHSAWKSLREAIEDDLKERYIFYVQRDRAKLVLGVPLDWAVAIEGFKPTTTDIQSAIKCYALDQPTACVFHLMRAMEFAVRKLSKRLGLSITPEITWGVLTGNMTDKIAKWPKDTVAQRRKKDIWAESVINLHHVGKVWRNKTMHPAKTYTAQEAHKVVEAVREFMTGLAAL